MRLFPNSNYYCQWTPTGAGTNWACVNKDSGSDSVYVYSTAMNQKDLYGFTRAIPNGSKIQGVVVNAIVKAFTSSMILIRQVIYVGSSPYYSGSTYVFPAWQGLQYSLDVNPYTGVAWTANDINEIGANAINAIGVEDLFGGSTVYSLCCACWIDITYTPRVPRYGFVNFQKPGIM